MKKNLILVLLLTQALITFAGGGQETGDKLSGTISIAGSSTVYPISVAVAEEFSKMHPDVSIPVQSTGTGGGFKNFYIPGKTDINDASRPMKDSERVAAEANGIKTIEIQVATDGITVVVNPDADWLDNITVKQLNMIWRADNPAKKWSDVDPSWPNQEIELYGPTAASGTFDYFTEVINGEEGLSRSDYQGTEQDNTIVQAISGSKYAMGYFGMAYYLENKDKVKALKIEGISPSIETAKSGVYKPLARPIFIYVSSKALARPEVVEYVKFYINQTDTNLIKEIGYVPLNTSEKDKMMNKLDTFLGNL
ncbi:MAG: PstS family phosphate ABC transporter substrate-binding protein [Spirochaetales bacterium]|nr:PstS family phosphate ABC transporter substrate-binding protein [Spirochaetales bacterium]